MKALRFSEVRLQFLQCPPQELPGGVSSAVHSQRDLLEGKSLDSRPRQLWVTTARGENPRRLSDRIVYTDALNEISTLGFGPRWSPDDRVVGFLSPDEDEVYLWLVDPDGNSEPRRAPRFPGLMGFDWYRDSRRVILSRLDRDAGQMVVEVCYKFKPSIIVASCPQ